MSTKISEDIEQYHALATLESARGYLHFLDYVTVDAQPEKKPFRHIAEWWQWRRSRRAAPALDHLAGITKNYTGPKSFWNGYHKGSDKTHDDARELCWLLGWSKRRLHCYVCAGKEEQAALITTAMQGILFDNPWIAERVSVTKLTGTGKSGSTLTILPMNAYTGQGIFPDYIIASEVTHWMYDDGKRFWEFILESVNKRPNCVLKVETNAGMKGTWQWDERNRIERSPYWSFFEAPVGLPLPTWMNQEKIDDDSQGLTPGERDRLYKNRWVDPGEEHGYLTQEECEKCIDYSLGERTHGDRGEDYFAVVDYGGVHDRTALSVLHVLRGGEQVIVDRLDCWQGTHGDRIDIVHNPLDPSRRSVESWLEIVRKNFRLSALVLDPYQLEALAIKYERMGLRVLRFEYRSGKANYQMAQLLKTCIQNLRIRWSPHAGRLPQSIVVDGRTKMIEDDTLEKELAMLVTKVTAYGYRFDHESGRHDDRAVCLAMGLVHALPEGVPLGSLGPTVIHNDKKVLPIGSEPSYRNEREADAVNRWNIYGANAGGSAWDRGDIT